MIKKAEIIIEQFEQGITIRWKDLDGEVSPSKSLAILGTEYGVIGREVWKDVSSILCDSTTDKVRIKLEYDIVNQ